MSDWRGGIDEAGYGAVLGPLVHAGAACREGAGIPDSFRRKGLLPEDSKHIYRAGKGLPRMEETVLHAAALSGWGGGGLFSLLDHLCGKEAPRARLAFARVGADDPPLPMFGRSLPSLPGPGNAFTLHARFTFPREFNLLLGKLNKSEAAMARLFGVLFRMVYSHCGTGSVLVDKQGGRNRYLPFLLERFRPDFVFALAEGAEESTYKVGEKLTISFRPNAESRDPLTALASMTAKYLRECYMAFFNTHWTFRVPGLVRTAGYPADGKRFFERIAPLLGEESLQRTDVLRIK